MFNKLGEQIAELDSHWLPHPDSIVLYKAKRIK